MDSVNLGETVLEGTVWSGSIGNVAAPQESGVMARTLGALSTSTGSTLADALVGGVVGYLVAPKSEKVAFVVGGAAATGLAGILGLLGTAFVGFERRG